MAEDVGATEDPEADVGPDMVVDSEVTAGPVMVALVVLSVKELLQQESSLPQHNGL